MKKKLAFGLLLAALLLPWPVAYAYDGGAASASTYPVAVTPASANLTPQLNIYGGAIGSVPAGDLFYIDSENESLDVSFILFFTNTDELATTFRSLVVQIGISTQNADGSWSTVTDYGPASQSLYMTLQSNSCEFTVSGARRYKVSVLHGSYNALPRHPGMPDAVLPEFYITPSM